MNNNIKDSYSTKVTDHDLAIADKDRDGVLYSTDGKRLLGIERKDFSAYKYVIKEGTEVICDHAFSCSSIRNIVIPDSVIVIGERAFNECTSLKYVDIGKGVKIIKTFAFRCCSDLEELSLPKNIETIEAMAFSYTGLKELTIPQFCSQITGNPIAYKNIRIKSKSPHFIVEDDILFTSNKHELISFQSSILSYTIPNSVTRISSYAFWYSTNLESIVIPPSVKYIGINPFAYCNLVISNQSKEISLKKGLLIDIKRNAIIGCYSDNKTICIPDGIKSIERSAFCNSKITEVKLPYSVKSIKDYAFESSTIEKVKLPNSVIYLGNTVFLNCSSLEKVNLPKYLDYYGEALFKGCTSLKNIDIPDCIKYIKGGMFNDCQWITVHRTGRRTWREYDSMNLIATTPGNKDKLVKMLPKFLHSIIKEMTYKEFVNREKSLYSNVNTEEEYDFGSLERVKCPRCGNWYFEDNGVCDICGYPWNE